MKRTIKHDMAEWFKETQLAPIDYFEQQWIGNKIGTFKVQRSFNKNFDTRDKLAKLFIAIGESYIQLALKLKPVLKSIPFEMLEEEDRDAWRNYVLHHIQYASYNRQIIQVASGVNVSTSGTTINVDSTPWGTFTSDMLSTEGLTLIQNTDIDFYEIIEEDKLWYETPNGNVVVIAKFDDLNDVPNTI